MGEINGDFIAQTKPKRATLHAVITRADGRVEDLGVISYYHRKRLLRWFVNSLISLKRRITG